MSEGKKYDIKYYSEPKGPVDRESLEKAGYKMLNDEETKKVIDALVRMYPRDESIQSLPLMYDKGSILFMYRKDIGTICVYWKDVGVFLDILETKLENLFPGQI